MAAWDLFISHASEDKAVVALPLCEILQTTFGLKIWLDQHELRVGDSLREKIDQGLAHSAYGIVVLSPAFFAKEWTKLELDALIDRQISEGRTLILPIWHNISRDDISRVSPILASRLGISTGVGIIAVADSIMTAMSPSSRPHHRFNVPQECRVEKVPLLARDEIDRVLPFHVNTPAARERIFKTQEKILKLDKRYAYVKAMGLVVSVMLAFQWGMSSFLMWITVAFACWVVISLLVHPFCWWCKVTVRRSLDGGKISADELRAIHSLLQRHKFESKEIETATNKAINNYY